jgi:ketosteroid isomerase-like protein
MVACPIEDRLAIQDLIIAYAHAVDTMTDLDAICAVFTCDVVFDLSGIGLPALHGHDGVRQFYTGAFAQTSHYAHYLTNFAVTGYAGDTASMRAYVIGKGLGRDGSTLTVHGRFYFDVVRDAAGWKGSRFAMDLLLPPGGVPDNAPDVAKSSAQGQS